jgi:sigma-54 specific flagellar transcriptional regulator A
VVDIKDLPQKYCSDMADLSLLPEAGAGENGADAPPARSLLPDGGIDMKQYLTDIEISLIEQALDETNNVVARAANLLNMRRTTLVEKMRKYEIAR